MRHSDGKGLETARGVLLAGLALALAASAGVASAQLSPKKGPIDVTGNSMDVRDPDHLIMWRGRVEALQDDDRLRSDALDIFYKSAPKTPGQPKAATGTADFGDIDHMVATGNVYFVAPTQVARGDKAVYTADNHTIVVTGDVVLTQGQDVGRGTRLTIDLLNGHQTLECTANCRPRVIFYNNKTKTQQGQGH